MSKWFGVCREEFLRRKHKSKNNTPFKKKHAETKNNVIESTLFRF